MEVSRHDPGDVAGFAAAARPLLEADPVRHTVALSVLDKLCRQGAGAAALLTVRENDRVVDALLRPVGLRAIVSAVRVDAAAAVERTLAEVDPELPGAVGPAPEVEAFAAAHVARSGAAVRVDLRLRLFALDRLTPPTGVVGAARTATAQDMDLIDAWMEEFMAEAIPHDHDPGHPREQATHTAEARHRLVVWEVDGEPVSLAVARLPAAGTSRIGPVYTPLRHRGHGYAAGVTTAAVRWVIDSGAQQVVLFTDLSNATTNRLYPRIGFRPVYDALEVSFVAPSSDAP